MAAQDESTEAAHDPPASAATSTWKRVAGQIRTFREVLAALVLLGFMLYFFVRIDEHVSGRRGQALLDPDVWPTVLLGTGVALSAVYLVLALVDVRRAKRTRALTTEGADEGGAAPLATEPEPEVPSLSRRLRTLAAVALLVAYVALMPTVGFVPVTFVFAIAFLALLGERRILMLLGLPLVTVAVVIGVFTQLLVVPLPRGIGPFLELSTWLY
ncbi:tripartite tricarboxylate transporter TctB family protein [Egibacter rhizosphaerae]|uniref:Tripartite tricarboxylate transporter TctB family protein n=1 Tax=Egibacter rhizosphaerae TaxID=1670831 RepID=A0A411YJV4_9ACTN|nr:tripartite tricarboxylate transporter TctB family protein [Egibacter rhizosphaerae]QBI21481.1 tripartite tricarboxylate transporter TctB family protein [Egibacter rhizosphaerae]